MGVGSQADPGRLALLARRSAEAIQRTREHAATGDWLATPALRRRVAILLWMQTVVFAFLFAGARGWIVPLQHPGSLDFVSFYAAGVLADSGHALAAYSRIAHHAAEQAALGPGTPYEYFLYPPPFLLVCGVLGRLPLPAAFLAFEAVTLVGGLAVLRAILDLPWRRCIAGLLAFPAVPWVLLLGQNSFFTAGLFAGALLLLERRPLLAGLLVACLACKPQYALLVPVAFMAGGHWRAFAAAAAGTVLICALSTWLFSPAIWNAYLVYLSSCQPDFRAELVASHSALVMPYGAFRSAGAPRIVASVAQAIATALAVGAVAMLWRRQAALPLRAAGLLAASMIAAPFSLFYDFVFILAALCWLVRHGRRGFYPPWSATVMAACWMLPGLAPIVGHLHVQLAALVAPAVLLLSCTWDRARLPGHARRALTSH